MLEIFPTYLFVREKFTYALRSQLTVKPTWLFQDRNEFSDDSK